jgi:hypothetical protein
MTLSFRLNDMNPFFIFVEHTIVAVISFCVIYPNIQFMLSQVTLNTSTYHFGIFDIFSSPSGGGGGHRRLRRRRVILGRGSRCTTKAVAFVRRRPPSSHRRARPRNAVILSTHPGGGRRARAPLCVRQQRHDVVLNTQCSNCTSSYLYILC